MSLLGVCLTLFMVPFALGQSYIRSDWSETDAWSRSNKEHTKSNIDHHCDCNSISSKINIQENISMIYYKKLVKFIFNPNNFEFDDQANVYQRGMVFTLTKKQLDALEKLTDPRDLDAIVGKILPKIQTVYMHPQPNWFEKCLNFLYSLIPSFSISEMRVELMLIIGILAIIYIRHYYGYSLLIIILFGIFLSGFVYKYFECNRELEIQQLADLYDGFQNNPCDDWKKEPSIWNLWGLFSRKPSKSECLDYLRKKNKLKLPFCRPDRVFLGYINDVILDQFQMTVERSTKIFKNIVNIFRFPYNIIACLIFGFTLMGFLRYTMKYIISPRNWSGFSWFHYKNQNYTPMMGSNIHYDDKLSGDNLKNFLEICKEKLDIRKHRVENITISASGVQVLASIPIKDNLKSNTKNEKYVLKTVVELPSTSTSTQTIVSTANKKNNSEGISKNKEKDSEKGMNNNYENDSEDELIKENHDKDELIKENHEEDESDNVLHSDKDKPGSDKNNTSDLMNHHDIVEILSQKSSKLKEN